MISLVNVSVYYKNFLAIDNINININDGEFFTLLGPSGCGKTTILRTIAGFEKPKLGQIIIDNKDITIQKVEERKIGFVFQNYALFPTMTVFENIQFGLKVRKYSKNIIKEKIDTISNKMDIYSCLDKKISELSGGQQQRVAFARALVLEPKVLLLDEPLSNLDAKLRTIIRREIKKLQRDLKITTLYVTHDQEEALAISDRIAVVNNGKIEQIGFPSEIYNMPKTDFVTRFIGEINYLNKQFIKKINKLFNWDLDVNKRYYIRHEQIIAVKNLVANVEKDNAILSARVINVEFIGAYIKTTFDLDNIVISNITFNAKEELKCNNKVYIMFNNVFVK